MSAAELFLDYAVYLSLGLLTLAFLFTVIRVIMGPTLPDRILGLDTLVLVAIGYIAVFAVNTRYYLFIDVALALALVGFLATVAFARFVVEHGMTTEDREDARGGEEQ
jgi:multicomponent Na+:H+ antiporter subunit F